MSASGSLVGGLGQRGAARKLKHRHSLFGPPEIAEWFLLARRRPGTAAAIAPGAGVAAGPARQEERRSVVAGRGAETAARAREFDGESPRASRRSHRRGGSTHRGRFVDRRRGYGFTPNAIDDLAGKSRTPFEERPRVCTMSTTSKNETAPLLGKGGGTSNRASRAASHVAERAAATPRRVSDAAATEAPRSSGAADHGRAQPRRRRRAGPRRARPSSSSVSSPDSRSELSWAPRRVSTKLVPSRRDW